MDGARVVKEAYVTKDERKAVEFARNASLGLPGSIKDVADYLLSEGTGIESQTMAQVAAHTYVSKPTLVRFAKQAGYSGWTAYRRDFLLAMKRVEAERTRQARVDVNHPFNEDANAQEVAAAIARIHHLATEEVEHTVNPAALHDSAAAILSADHVVCLGAMQNLDRGRVFAANLALAGVWCQAPRSDEVGPLVGLLGPGDCVVAVSYSGDVSHHPLSVVPRLQQQGITVVAITNSKHSQLGNIAHAALTFAPLEHLHQKTGPFYSGACTSLLLDILFAECYAQRYVLSMKQRNKVLGDLEGFVPADFAK